MNILKKIKLEHVAITLLAIAIINRIYIYINHKDLWLDEAFVAVNIFNTPLIECFFKQLEYGQAIPLGFLLATKIMGFLFGYSEHVLYFIPVVCGILSCIISYKIAKILFSSFGVLTFMTLILGSTILLYYSAELKQYGIEAFCSFLLIYIYLKDTKNNNLKNLSLKKFSFIAIGCIIFSNTIIFIAIPILVSYIYIYIYIYI